MTDGREPDNQGQHVSLDAIMPEVLDELRAIADRQLQHERRDHTLQPSALVNEVYLRLEKQRGTGWVNRAHFFAAASEAIRRILIEHARRRNAAKRGDGRRRISLEDAPEVGAAGEVDLIELEDALSALGRQDQRLERVVQLRFFGGLTMSEVAEVLGLSKRTIEVDWAMARAWLQRAMDQGTESS